MIEEVDSLRMRRDLGLWLCLGFSAFVLSGCKSAAVLGGPAEPDRLIDGAYQGTCKNGPNSALVEVTVRERRIADVKILKHNAWKGKKAEPVIPRRIVEKQSTAVDAVSGATNSSNVIMNAVQNAIEKSYASNQGAK
jgi:uncharacterized protein with FMN-binding domain